MTSLMWNSVGLVSVTLLKWNSVVYDCDISEVECSRIRLHWSEIQQCMWRHWTWIQQCMWRHWSGFQYCVTSLNLCDVTGVEFTSVCDVIEEWNSTVYVTFLTRNSVVCDVTKVEFSCMWHPTIQFNIHIFLNLNFNCQTVAPPLKSNGNNIPEPRQ